MSASSASETSADQISAAGSESFMKRFGLIPDDIVACKSKPLEIVPNGLVLELLKLRVSRHADPKSLCQWLLTLIGFAKQPLSEQSIKAITSSLQRVRDKHATLLKNKSRPTGQATLTNFLDSSYSLPSSIDLPPPLSQPAESPEVEEGIEEEVQSDTEGKLASMGQRIEKANSKLRNLKKKLHRREKSLSEKTEELQSILQKSQELTSSVQQYQDQVKEADQKVEDIAEKHETLTSRYKQAVRMLRYYKEKAAEHRAATQEATAATAESRSAEYESSLVAARQLKDELTEADSLISCLEEQLEELSTEAVQDLETFRDGKYTDEMRQCCMSLLALNVGLNNVSPIIQEVLKLVDKRPTKLPSYGALQNMVAEGRSISLTQIGEVAATSTSTTLHYDGTSKFGRKYMGFQLTTEEGQYTMSINDLASGSAEHTLDLFKQVIAEVTAIGERCGQTVAGEKLLASLTNTMTDRAAVNTKFNDLLEGYRKEVLAATRDDWQELSEEEQCSIAKLNNHFCGLHMLVNLAEQCNAVLVEFENMQSLASTSSGSVSGDIQITDKSESGTIRLVRTCCKTFERHGSEQAGRMVEFAEYCRENGVSQLPLAKFKGNRFNILFYDAAGVYFLHQLMASYCTLTERNKLVDAVAADLAKPHLLSGCRALGIIGKLLTGPLWRFLVSSEPFTSVFKVYDEVTSQMAAWAEDASDLMDGSGRPFSGADVHTATPVFQALFTPSDADASTKQALELLCATFHSYMVRAWAPYLPGGHLATVSSASTANLPKTNILSEHDFAQLDRFLREKPNSTTLAVESMIMLANNHTMGWLSTKTEQERATILQAARASVPYQRDLARQRKAAIQEYRRKKLKEQQEKKEKQQQRHAHLVQNVTQALARYGGLWVTTGQLEANMAVQQTATAKKEAIKTQLRFRKHAMSQQNRGNAHLFAFSKAGAQLSISAMEENLRVLITSVSPQQPAEDFPDELEGLEEEPAAEDSASGTPAVPGHGSA